MTVIITPYDDPADGERQAEWTEAFPADLAGQASGVSVNIRADEDEYRVHEAYLGDTHRRLAAIKRRYDPGNRFRFDQNIRPGG